MTTIVTSSCADAGAQWAFTAPSTAAPISAALRPAFSRMMARAASAPAAEEAQFYHAGGARIRAREPPEGRDQRT